MFLVGGDMLKNKCFISSSKGSLTVQFLLGFVLILSFMVIFGAMTLTLAVASITQYITYASSRALFLSSRSEALQKDNARDKFNLLKSQLVNTDGLIDISQVSLDNDQYLNEDFGFISSKPYLFYGVWTKFLPKILKMETLWGNTTDDNVRIFETVVGSYLGREPSMIECISFNDSRWGFIKNMQGGYTGSNNTYGFCRSDRGLCDNGC